MDTKQLSLSSSPDRPHGRQRARAVVGAACLVAALVGAPPAGASRVPAGVDTVTGYGDTAGYHLYAAGRGDGYAWHALASLRPAGGGDEAWIGQQCLTGDGRTVVAVVAPWHAANSEDGMDRGGYAYAVDVRDGSVHPLARGVSLAYFNPGCGSGSQAALTSYLAPNEAVTRVSLLDAGTRRLQSTVTVPVELTSAAPVHGRLLAARGHELVALDGGHVTSLGRLPGQVTEVRPAASGADMLSVAGTSGQVWHWTGHGLTRVGSGPGSGLADAPDLRGATRTTLPAAAPVRAAAVPAVNLATGPNTSNPTCVVGRNDAFKQVFQPSPDQIRWAINQAVQGALGPPYTTVKRPTANAMYAISGGAYAALPTAYADADFPLVAGAPRVPPLVLYGILAQESNWQQASWHAAVGRAGNPLTANYYGSGGPTDPPINYDNADCGYGIGQITDGMKVAGGAGAPTAQQLRVSVDYATNVAAAVRILQTKWVQLHQLGITMNNDDPTKVENWYGAIWAYNSGVHTDPGTYQGLGWYNNPANPVWKVGRHTFLHIGLSVTSGDASNPNFWPYQERVFGWMEVPLMSGNVLDYRGTYDWDTNKGTFLATPSPVYFCAASNACDINQIGVGDPCPDEDGRCYWHTPVTWVNCAKSCITDTVTNAPNGHTYHTTPGDPEPALAPLPSTCSLSANSPGAGAIVVDDETLDTTKNNARLTPNLMGCPLSGSGLVPPASAKATFEVQDANGADALSNPATLAAIDVHQLGGGLGGHLFFTHTGPSSQAGTESRGVWSAWLSSDPSRGTAYQIKAFIPDIAAASTHATYQIYPGGQAGYRGGLLRRTIDQSRYSNQWVSLGYYLCAPSSAPSGCQMTVTLHSITSDDDASQGSDIAFDAVAFVPVPTGGYVSLGDSYSSGEGLGGPWDDGTDTTPQPGDNGNLCHRSSGSYPRLYAQAAATSVIQLACSGANLWDLAGIEYWRAQNGVSITNDGSVAYPTEPSGSGWQDSRDSPEAAGSNYFDEPTYQTDLVRAMAPRRVTLTVGGNDLGFADVVFNCIKNHALFVAGGNGSPCRADYVNSTNPAVPDKIDNRITTLRLPVADALAAVVAAVGGDPSKVVLLTYPLPAAPSPGNAGSDIDCSYMFNVDREWLQPKVGELSDMLAGAAGDASRRFDPTGAKHIIVVDERNAFQGHEVCSADPYVTAPDIWPWDSESTQDNFFHPNAAGYRKLEQDLAAAVPTP